MNFDRILSSKSVPPPVLLLTEELVLLRVLVHCWRWCPSTTDDIIAPRIEVMPAGRVKKCSLMFALRTLVVPRRHSYSLPVGRIFNRSVKWPEYCWWNLSTQ